MQVEVRPIKSIRTAKYNPRKISDQALEALKQSIQRFGFVDPVIVNDRTGVLVGGHQRIKAAKELGLKDVPVVGVNLDEGEEKALNVALNKISGEWDLDLLKGVLEDVQAAGLDLSLTGFSEDEWLAMVDKSTFDEQEQKQLSEKYTHKIASPVYEVKGSRPSECELRDESLTNSLISEINEANLPNEIASFLRSAAQRHTVWNYRMVAEYYAHADSQVQALMERSALIIIDYNRAVELGFVQLTEAFAELFEDEHEQN
jgi:hypothetical protein